MVLLLTIVVIVGVDSSGYYYDNGMQQTVMAGGLDALEAQVVQEEILHLLGLSYRPGTRGGRRPVVSNGTVPTFMRDIYHSLINVDGGAGETNVNMSQASLDSLATSQFKIEEKDLKAINTSDIIMSFVNYGHQEEFETTRRFWFDVSEVPMGDTVLSAELRIYKEARKGKGLWKIGVYQLVDGTTGEQELLDSLTLSLDQEGWVLLDVSPALLFWQAFPKHNLGLLLRISAVEEDNGEGMTPHDLGLVGDRVASSPRESFMVAYIKDGSRGEITLNARSKRSSKSSKGRSSRRKTKQFSYLEQDFGYDNVYRDFYGGQFRRQGCQKRILFVSFRDLGWQDWIIAPDGYSAFYCHGECSFPLNTHMNATNHAIVQTLVHLMTPRNVPKPCCAPTKLSGISVLYFDESSNVILKKYRNMVVKSCGCH